MSNPTNKARVLVATPMYGGMCTGSYASSLMHLPLAMGKAGMQMYYIHMVNESLITRARNTCADEFLKTDATHLMFIDADIGFNPNDIPNMVEKDVDILCGLYPKKEINWVRVANAAKKDVPPQELAQHAGAIVVNMIENKDTFVANGDLLEIHNGGTGFMLIKREVFEALADKVPSYTNDIYLSTVQNPEPQYIKEYFATSIDPESNRLLSEDYHFCVLARKYGYKVMADPMIDLSHTGTYVFTGATEKVPA